MDILGVLLLILLTAAVLLGGLLALFAGRRLYAVWLGFATYFFTSRLLDLALFRYPDAVRDWGGLVIALLVVAVVLWKRDRMVRFVVPLGGFIVTATIAERLLRVIHPEAGKFLFFAILVFGGLFRSTCSGNCLILIMPLLFFLLCGARRISVQ